MATTYFNDTKLNPFGEIKKLPLQANGVTSSAYSIHLETPLDEKHDWKEVGVVGNDYLLVPNSNVVDMVHEMTDKSDMEWQENRTFFNGRQFMYSMTTNDITAEVAVGDTVGLGIAAWNSYNGSRNLSYSFFANRLACLNGMTSKVHFFDRRFKHDNTSVEWAKELEGIVNVMHNASQNLVDFAGACKKLNEMGRLNTIQLAAIRSEYIPGLPVTIFGKIMDKYLMESDYEEQTGWDLLNASTNLLWHNKKGTAADYDNNQYITDGLLEYAKERDSWKAASI